MSQRAALEALDASLHAAFATCGLADSGTYQAGVAAPVSCRVYVDRDVQMRGEFGQVIGKRTELAILRADVDPVRGATVAVDGDVHSLVEEIEGSDPSLSRWAVRDG